jgi:hypothetical protein
VLGGEGGRGGGEAAWGAREREAIAWTGARGKRAVVAMLDTRKIDVATIEAAAGKASAEPKFPITH